MILTFVLGVFVGAIIMDICWAYKLGILSMMKLRFKIWRLKFRGRKNA